MVHRREVDGNALVFGNQGDLWQNAMTWFDHGTGSIWSQPTGEAIMGPLKGTTLDLLPSTLSTWADWRDRFPDSLALDVESVRSGFTIEQMVVVSIVDDDSVAVPFVDLRAAGAVSTELADEPILIVADPDFDRWSVYSRLVDGVETPLERNRTHIVDPATGRRWNPSTGASLDGALPLDRLPSFSSFADDYAVFFPEGEILDLR